jgi:trans-2,3-dihydro-3-hydroxyanthranilate isomerase
MRFSIVDVFAEAPYSGNQLAVVEQAAGLSGAQMQRIARETNFSETTFVTDHDAASAKVRIFTPSEELGFAGHPTLGTAWVLTHGDAPISLELGVGHLSVWFDEGIAWMRPPAVERLEDVDAARVAGLVGLDAADLEPDLGAATIECGSRFAFIGVRDLAALRRAHAVGRASDFAGTGWPFVVCRGGYSPHGDFAARMFFHDGVAMREDPATGSANAAFGHLLRRGRCAGSFVVEQGFEIGRPSRVYLRVGDEIEVGGKVQAVAEGLLVSQG